MDGILSCKEVLETVGFSKQTLYRRIKAVDFPRPIQISPQRVGWRKSEVAEWMETRKRSGKEPEPDTSEDQN